MSVVVIALISRSDQFKNVAGSQWGEDRPPATQRQAAAERDTAASPIASFSPHLCPGVVCRVDLRKPRRVVNDAMGPTAARMGWIRARVCSEISRTLPFATAPVNFRHAHLLYAACAALCSSLPYTTPLSMSDCDAGRYVALPAASISMICVLSLVSTGRSTSSGFISSEKSCT
jgi:hypothetical protein